LKNIVITGIGRGMGAMLAKGLASKNIKLFAWVEQKMVFKK